MKNRPQTAAGTPAPAAPPALPPSHLRPSQAPANKRNSTSNFPSKKRNPRPGVLMRGMLSDTYALRGKSQGKLWLHYSAHARRDVAFPTELGYVHFLYAESSFDITQVDYTPAERVTRAVGESFAPYVDAHIELANGDVIWRHVCAEPSDTDRQTEAQMTLLLEAVTMPDGVPKPRLQTLTSKELFESEHRIRNWHRVASWLAAARDWELNDYETAVAGLMRRQGRAEFQEVLALGEGGAEGCLFGAALLRQLQRGAYRSNLFDAPFTLRSIFSEKREAS